MEIALLPSLRAIDKRYFIQETNIIIIKDASFKESIVLDILD